MANHFDEQQSRCTMCGHIHKLTAHHKIRRSAGGTRDPWNVVGVCRPCHDRIHGFGTGCEVECGYPNLAGAQIASDAHWAIVRDHWEHEMALDAYDRREARSREDAGESLTFFALQLKAVYERTTST